MESEALRCADGLWLPTRLQPTGITFHKGRHGGLPTHDVNESDWAAS
jgi:hypothetical protein